MLTFKLPVTNEICCCCPNTPAIAGITMKVIPPQFQEEYDTRRISGPQGTVMHGFFFCANHLTEFTIALLRQSTPEMSTAALKNPKVGFIDWQFVGEDD